MAFNEKFQSQENLNIDPFEEIIAYFSDLKGDIENTNKSRKVEKLKSGRIKFPYDRKGEKRDFIIEKIGDKQVSVWIKKLGTDGQRYTQDNTSLTSKIGKPILVNFKNNQSFNIELGKILDTYIGKDRKTTPKKGQEAYRLLTENNSENAETNKKSLRNKPIDLGYDESKFTDKSIKLLSFPEVERINDYDGRIMRGLRWKPITDAVEDRYSIPRGLLMAMMAQETYGDPTMPNKGGDGGLGIIHIQGKNASDYGLKTLKRYNEGMRDTKHGQEIKNALDKYKYNPEHLIKANIDDRFHPIMAIDVAARFLKAKKTTNGKDAWILALKRYSGRGLSDYAYPTLRYRTTINAITGENMPTFTEGVEKVKKEKKIEKMIKKTKESIKNCNVKIDGKESTYEDYKNHFKKACDAYELEKYKKLGKY